MSIHIGSVIKNFCREKQISAVELSNLLGYKEASIYKIVKSAHVSTRLLFRISEVLKHNFFQYFEVVLGDDTAEKYEKLKKDYELLVMENELLKKMLKITNG